MSVPLPFGDTTSLQPPVVLNVDPTCVNAGNNFTINGTGFYPGLVTHVLINGKAVQAGVTLNSDASITVTAPDESFEAAPVVVETQLGTSDSKVTIEISAYGFCNLSAARAADRIRN